MRDVRGPSGRPARPPFLVHRDVLNRQAGNSPASESRQAPGIHQGGYSMSTEDARPVVGILLGAALGGLLIALAVAGVIGLTQ